MERDGFVFDSGPSLLTMPWVLRDLFANGGRSTSSSSCASSPSPATSSPTAAAST